MKDLSAYKRVLEAVPGFEVLDVLAIRGKSVAFTGMYASTPAVLKCITAEGNVEPWLKTLAHEVQVYKAFEEYGSPVQVPNLLWADLDQGVAVLEYIPGAVLSEERVGINASNDLDWDRIITNLLTIRKWTHSETQPIETFRRSYFTKLSRYIESMHLNHEDLSRAKLIWHKARIQPEFSHGDLLLSNIIDKGDSLVFIDWEHSSNNLPFFDLALVWVLYAEGPEATTRLRWVAGEGYGESAYFGFLLNVLLLTGRELWINEELPDGLLKVRVKQYLTKKLEKARSYCDEVL